MKMEKIVLGKTKMLFFYFFYVTKFLSFYYLFISYVGQYIKINYFYFSALNLFQVISNISIFCLGLKQV